MAAPNPTATTRIPFPEDAADFDKDVRISFSKPDNRWILEDDDGSEWEYNEAAKKWMPSMDEADVLAQQQTYALPDSNGPPPTDQAEQSNNNLKRKNDATSDQQSNGNGKAAKRSKNSGAGDNQPKQERKNTAVYVQDLPPDVTQEELVTVFSRYGVIAENLETGQPRAKLYTETDGTLKGDALVVYFRPESVQLAIQMLDESDFRPGETFRPKIKVSAAEKSYKKQNDAELKPDQAKGKAKKRLQKQAEKMKSKLTEWDDDDPAAMHQTSSRWDKVVILKHMFTLEELEADEKAAEEIAQDVQEEASRCGPVDSVILFDREVSGVLSIRFENPQAAQACVNLMNGRLFGGQKVEAYIADGIEKFKKSKKGPVHGESDDEKRMEEFGDWLEGKGGNVANFDDGVGAGGGEETR